MFRARGFVKAKHNMRLLKTIVNAFNFASDEDVLVGIPAENTAGYGSGVTNIQLLYIHSQGSPVNGIPARPTVEPAIQANRAMLATMLRGSLAMAFTGNIAGARAAKARAGQMAANLVKARFGSGSLAPLKPATIKAKGSSAPLIDTGQLRNSITYVIRKK